jgi:hypothetical protein
MRAGSHQELQRRQSSHRPATLCRQASRRVGWQQAGGQVMLKEPNQQPWLQHCGVAINVQHKEAPNMKY